MTSVVDPVVGECEKDGGHRKLRYQVDGLCDHVEHMVIAGRQTSRLLETASDLQRFAQKCPVLANHTQLEQRNEYVALDLGRRGVVLGELAGDDQPLLEA